MKKVIYKRYKHINWRITCLILLFALIYYPASSQGNGQVPENTSQPQSFVTGYDTISAASDTIAKAPKKSQEKMNHSPRKAMIYALVLPGLGQAYNKKYFKIPFVYAALGGVGYLIYYNNGRYNYWLDTAENDPANFDERYLKFSRRNLELSYIALVGAYALQVLDAYVDANLFYWDVNPDLSIRIEPSIEPPFYSNPSNSYGLKCKLTF